MTGVTLYPGSVALAHVERVPDQPPRLVVCDHVEGSDPGALLRSLVARHQLQGSRCVLCLHPTQYSATLLERPEVADDELNDALRWRIGDLIDYPADEAVVDAFDAAEGTAEREANQVTVVVAQRALVEELHGMVTGAGLVPWAFDIHELCQRNLSELLPENERGLLMVQLRHTMTQMYGFQQGQLLLSRRTSILGNELVSELEQLTEGEIGGAHAVENLTVEIQRTVTFYATRARRGHPSGLILAPFPHALPGLATHLTQMVDIPTRLLDLNVVLDCAQHVDDALQAAAADAVGAALRREEEAA